jgi:hypothetical protein
MTCADDGNFHGLSTSFFVTKIIVFAHPDVIGGFAE